MLLQYGNSSPLLNEAYQQANIRQGDFVASARITLESTQAWHSPQAIAYISATVNPDEFHLH